MVNRLKRIFLKNKKKKIGVIIEARSNSSRLPNKHFLKVFNKTILEHLIFRIKNISNINTIIIATTKNKSDDKISKLAKRNNVKVFRGSENNVTQRVLEAAKHYKLNFVCEITGDCPIIDPFLVEQLVDTFLLNSDKIDYMSNSQLGLPNGMGCQIFSTKILQDSYKNITKEDEFEHVTLHIRRNPKIYKQVYFLPQKKLSWTDLGLTLDEKKDYLLLKKIIEYFSKKPLFTCEDVIDLLNKRKKWIKINSKVKRKENYIKI